MLMVGQVFQFALCISTFGERKRERERARDLHAYNVWNHILQDLLRIPKGIVWCWSFACLVARWCLVLGYETAAAFGCQEIHNVQAHIFPWEVYIIWDAATEEIARMVKRPVPPMAGMWALFGRVSLAVGCTGIGKVFAAYPQPRWLAYPKENAPRIQANYDECHESWMWAVTVTVVPNGSAVAAPWALTLMGSSQIKTWMILWYSVRVSLYMFVLGTCSVQMPEVRQLLAKLSERDGKIMELTLKLEVRLGLAVGYLGKIGHCTVRYKYVKCTSVYSNVGGTAWKPINPWTIDPDIMAVGDLAGGLAGTRWLF